MLMIYKKLPSSARASFWYAVAGVLQKGIAVIVVPLALLPSLRFTQTLQKV
jgi:hypothetical protein